MGKAVIDPSGALHLKSRACAAAGADQGATSAAHLAASANAGIAVTECSNHAQRADRRATRSSVRLNRAAEPSGVLVGNARVE
jgi:hypothetical protein